MFHLFNRNENHENNDILKKAPHPLWEVQCYLNPGDSEMDEILSQALKSFYSEYAQVSKIIVIS